MLRMRYLVPIMCLRAKRRLSITVAQQACAPAGPARCPGNSLRTATGYGDVHVEQATRTAGRLRIHDASRWGRVDELYGQPNGAYIPHAPSRAVAANLRNRERK